jgi:hypothetical protein
MNSPEWKVPARLLISTNQLAGELASWAVQQSPYDVPGGLEQAIRDFRAAWPNNDGTEEFEFNYWHSYDELYAALYEVFCSTPSIRAWNEPKSGHSAQVVFSDRYGGPAQDDDFIDLGALANNVAREVWKDELAFKDFNDDFEARWEADHGHTPFAQGMSAGTAETAEQAQGQRPASSVGEADAPKGDLQ